MPEKIVIDPLTRIEGHLAIEASVDGGRIQEARVVGSLYRGFEQILAGREPQDAIPITQRICGVCPVSHAVTSAQCLDRALGVMPTENGRIIRNLIQGANYIQSHIVHFYHLSLVDFVRGPQAPPFVPRYENDYRMPEQAEKQLVSHYLQALQARLKAHEMAAIFAGKIPHVASIVPGGVTVPATVDKVTAFLWRLNEVQEFIDNVYLADVMTVARVYRDYADMGAGPRNLLSFGVFDLDGEPDVTKRKRLFRMGRVKDGKLLPVDPAQITEDTRFGWYEGDGAQPPAKGETRPAPSKQDAYSWLKAPRYGGDPYEVGPLARVMVALLDGSLPELAAAADSALKDLGFERRHLYSVTGRHLARALEAQVLARAMRKWLLEIKPNQPTAADFKVPKQAEGFGLWEAPRGALGHWIRIEDRKIAQYQAVVPTTWNGSPRDGRGRPGPIEAALHGVAVKDAKNPFEIARIVRSFDPCIACAVHLATPRGEGLGEFRIL